MNDFDPHKSNPRPTIAELTNLYARNQNPNRLHAASKQLYYEGLSLAEAPGENLAYVLLVGDSSLGVSLVHELAQDGFKKITAVRVSALPLGESAGALVENDSSSTLAEVDLASLLRTRENGVVQPWEDISIGRATIAGATGGSDGLVSGAHLNLRVSSGSITIEDHSTNGTVIVAASDVAFGNFSEKEKERLVGFLQPLSEKPHKWNKVSAGKRVIDPGL
ncbi:MAG: hypothetical protein WBO49_03730 [Candidatus Saccharimonas sp.]